MSGYWVDVAEWEDVPKDCCIALWDIVVGSPSKGWYNDGFTITVGEISNGIVRFNYSTGAYNTYRKSTLQGYKWKYLKKYEPYDPSQEPEDDCL